MLSLEQQKGDNLIILCQDVRWRRVQQVHQFSTFWDEFIAEFSEKTRLQAGPLTQIQQVQEWEGERQVDRRAELKFDGWCVWL